MDSGLSQRAFCESRGLALSSFANAMRRRAGAEVGRAVAEDFVTISFVGTNDSGWAIELSLGEGVMLRFRRE